MKGDAIALTAVRTRASDFVMLAKPRLNMLVVASALAGYVMAGGDLANALAVVCTVIGTALVAGGASGFNQVMERVPDSLMRRTRLRPVPDGRLQPFEALVFATALALAGLILLATVVNSISAGVALVTLLTYALVYTPLKRRSSFATVIGAIPGALPPLMGWTASRGELSSEGWALFAILAFWQLPHFLAIAWLYRDEYAKAGFKMLPMIDPHGYRTGRQAVSHTLGLLPVSLFPFVFHLTGKVYLVGALALGLAFLWFAIRFARQLPSRETELAALRARQLFFASILYLPLLLTVMVLDKVK